jgi:hypothetical protein
MPVESKIDTKTPDWSIFGETSTLSGIVELTNFHADKKTEDVITQQLKTEGFWVGSIPPNIRRLDDKIKEKVIAYKALIEKYKVPYVIAVFGEFTADVDFDELNECLFNKESGIFVLYPAVSGVLFSEEYSGQYHFQYLRNQKSLKEFELPDGIFSFWT